MTLDVVTSVVNYDCGFCVKKLSLRVKSSFSLIPLKPSFVSSLHVKLLSFFFFSPEFPFVYQSDEEQERMMGLYQDLHSHMHHPTRPLRFLYRLTETENLLAWVSMVQLYHQCCSVVRIEYLQSVTHHCCTSETFNRGVVIIISPAGDEWL